MAIGEYMVLEEQYTHPIPDDWNYELGAWVETFSVGYCGIWGNGGYLDASDDVVILGAGPIGLVGHSIGRKVPVELGKVIWKNMRMTGSGGTKTFMPRAIKFLGRIRDNYDFNVLNTHRFSFEEIHKAFDVACHDKANARKVMLKFS